MSYHIGDDMFYHPFDSSSCDCFFCYCRQPQLPSLKPKKFRRSEMIAHANEFIESQVVLANRDAKLENQYLISGRLGPYNEYYFEYEWPSVTYDGYPVLNLIELLYTLSDDDEKVIKENTTTPVSRNKPCLNTRLQKQQQHGGAGGMVSCPLPYLIAFEKLASSFGRRLRIGSITHDNIKSFLMYHRRYSVQSDDNTSLIDKC